VAVFLAKHYGGVVGQPIGEPLHTVQTKPHYGEVRAFLIKYFGTDQNPQVREPLHTLTTKDRFGVVTVNIQGEPYIITDIGMRMLSPRELFRAQGFDDSYVIDIEIDGRRITKTDQVRMVGNSVCPPIAAELVRANLIESEEQVALREEID
jgi:DNA (cytosine-5)-methyltransferase 1